VEIENGQFGVYNVYYYAMFKKGHLKIYYCDFGSGNFKFATVYTKFCGFIQKSSKMAACDF